MYFSLVLTAGEHSPLDLRGLFLFLEEKLIVNVESVTQIKYGRAKSAVQPFGASGQPHSLSLICIEKHSYTCNVCSSHKSQTVLVALLHVTSCN